MIPSPASTVPAKNHAMGEGVAPLSRRGCPGGGIAIMASLLPVKALPPLERWVHNAILAGANGLHLDFMRPSGTDASSCAGFSLADVSAVRSAVTSMDRPTRVEVHVVVSEPTEAELAAIVDAGADSVTIHWEAFSEKDDLAKRLQFIQSHGARALLGIQSSTDVAFACDWVGRHSMLLAGISFSGTAPGAGGGAFDKRVLKQIAFARQYSFLGDIEVDGGIEPVFSAPTVRAAGANILVAGSAFFGKPRGRSVARLTEACRRLRGLQEPSQFVAVLPRFIPSQCCVRCGWKTTGLTEAAKCAECGSDVQFVHDRPVDLLANLDEFPGMWRYARVLPIVPEFITSVGEGFTRVVFEPYLSEDLGIRLYLKLESDNPTGTFKDREGSFVVSRALAAGADNLVFQSTGNTALALSHYAHIAGLSSWGFVPARNAYKLFGPRLGPRNHLILVNGEPSDVKQAATRFAQALGFPKVSPFHQRSEANVTIAYELGEAILRGQLPNFDVVAQTIAAGMGPIGIVNGMSRIARWSGNTVKLPRILGVELSEFAPLHDAWLEDRDPGSEADTPAYGITHPYEPTLHTTNARPYFPHLRAALRASGGDLVRVEPEQAREAEAELRSALSRHDVLLASTENSAFIGYAGLREKLRQGWVRPYNTVLLLITGKAIHPGNVQLLPDATVSPDFDPFELFRSIQGRGEVAHAA